jgi:hypothetical protein
MTRPFRQRSADKRARRVRHGSPSHGKAEAAKQEKPKLGITAYLHVGFCAQLAQQQQ